MENVNLGSVIDQVGKEKNIDKTVLVEALEAAMLSAARKKLGLESDLEARFNEDINEVEVYEFKQIVEEVNDKSTQITLEEALKLDPDLTEEAVGEDLGIKLDSTEFGRIAAQNAKQIIIQRVREAERNMIFSEYKDRKGELATGTVRRFERGNIIVDLGRAEAMVPNKEQIMKENVRIGDKIVAYVLDVLEISRGAQIILSRTHPNLVVKLFEQEVPEVQDGVITIEGVAREAGFRTKIAVKSSDSDVDPVGACVGMKGSRVQEVVQELRGEKIDIVPYDLDEARFICNALSPAEVTKVLINEGEHSMQIVVPDDQLSLAIGRRGQNVRLAAELTGWKIDIASETKLSQEKDLAWESLSRIEGLGEFQLQTLYNHGFRKVENVLATEESYFAALPGFEEIDVSAMLASAQAAIDVVVGEEKAAKEVSRQEAANMFVKSDKVSELAGDALDLMILDSVGDEELPRLQEAAYWDISDVVDDGSSERLLSLVGLSQEKADEIYGEAKAKLEALL